MTTTTMTEVFDQERTNGGPAPAGASAAPQLMEVSIDLVHPSRDNVRQELGDLEELTASIRAQGILQPLTVRPHPRRPDDYEVVAGHRRLAAAKRANLHRLPVWVRLDLGDRGTQLAAMLAENGHRSGLTAIEEAKAYQEILDLPGFTIEKAAKATGRSASTVRRRVELVRMPEEVQQRVHTGDVPLERAAALARFEDDPDAVEKLTKVLDQPDWQWASVHQQLKERRDWQKALPVVAQWLKEQDGDPLIGADTEGVREQLNAQAGEPEWYFYGACGGPGLTEAGELAFGPKVEEQLRAHLEAGRWPALTRDRPRQVLFFQVRTEREDPVKSEEELIQEAWRSRLENALRVERATAEKTLRKKMAAPAQIKGTAQMALTFYILDQDQWSLGDFLDALGIDVDVEFGRAGRLRDEQYSQLYNQLTRMTVDQLALALVMARTRIAVPHGQAAYDLRSRSPKNIHYTEAIRHREALAAVYGLTKTDVDRGVMDYWAPTLPEADAEDGE